MRAHTFGRKVSRVVAVSHFNHSALTTADMHFKRAKQPFFQSAAVAVVVIARAVPAARPAFVATGSGVARTGSRTGLMAARVTAVYAIRATLGRVAPALFEYLPNLRAALSAFMCARHQILISSWSLERGVMLTTMGQGASVT